MPRPDGDRTLLHDVLTSRVYDVARETPLERLGYPSVPEEDNAAYRLFLAGS